MSENEENQLLPCPFCGETPELTKHFKYDAHSLTHRCRVVGYIGFEFGDKERHIERWNTRQSL